MIVGKIEINSEICGGKPVLTNTRIPVAVVLGYLAAGDNFDDIIAAYPQITRDDILACLEYAVKSMNNSHGIYALS